MFTDNSAPWLCTNEIIRRDLHILTVKKEINNYVNYT